MTKPKAPVAPIEPLYVNQKEAAAMLGLTDVTVRRMIQVGDLPGYRVGRSIRIKKADVEALFKPIPVYR